MANIGMAGAVYNNENHEIANAPHWPPIIGNYLNIF